LNKKQNRFIQAKENRKSYYSESFLTNSGFRSQRELDQDLNKMRFATKKMENKSGRNKAINYDYNSEPSPQSNRQQDGVKNNLSQSIKDKRKLEKYQNVINHKIEGDSYFNCSSKTWRDIILKRCREYFDNKITIEGLIQYLKSQGVTFNQSETLIRYPIQELLEKLSKK
jgi:hypothetical protein